MHLKLQNLSEKCENRPTVRDNLILLKRYTTFKELVIKNTLVKNKTIFVLMEGFHMPQRQISLQKKRPEVFWKKGVLSQSLFFNKVAGFSLWKEKLWHRCFHVYFVKFLRTPFLQNTSGRLLLSLWEDRTFHYKVTFSLSFNSLKKCYSGSSLGKRCSMFFMFSRLHFKLWKINTLHFLEKMQTTQRLIILKNVSVFKVLACTEGRRIESRSVCLTEPNQNYP